MELRVKNVSSGYGKKPAIENISFSVREGEVLAVLGPNGSGKSTLFKTLMRFLPLMNGQILLDGQSTKELTLKEFARCVSYIPQQHTPTFSYTVREMVTMGRAGQIPAFGSPIEADKRAVDEALDLLHIQHLAAKHYTQISGGERRLALIARALCQKARFLIMDEPSSDLDYANQQLVQDTIGRLKSSGYGIILSTHAPEYPYSVATTALLLKKGRVVSSGPPSACLTARTLTDAFSVPMDVVSATDSKGNERKFCLPL